MGERECREVSAGEFDLTVEFSRRWSGSIELEPLIHTFEVGRRPLVVIDPEDREQLERLGVALFDAGFTATTRMQAALRSLLEPPKPPEPTNDGTLIGCHYDGSPGRAVLLNGSWTFCSKFLRDHSATWHDFTNVTVLSEGIA